MLWPIVGSPTKRVAVIGRCRNTLKLRVANARNRRWRQEARTWRARLSVRTETRAKCPHQSKRDSRIGQALTLLMSVHSAPRAAAI